MTRDGEKIGFLIRRLPDGLDVCTKPVEQPLAHDLISDIYVVALDVMG